MVDENSGKPLSMRDRLLLDRLNDSEEAIKDLEKRMHHLELKQRQREGISIVMRNIGTIIQSMFAIVGVIAAIYFGMINLR